MIPLWLISTGLTALDNLFGKEKRGKNMEKGGKLSLKIYRNCNYRNRSRTNKLIEPGNQCIFGGTDQLYYKKIGKEFISREKIITQSISKFHQDIGITLLL